MKKLTKLLIFALTLAVLLALPFTAQAKAKGYFQLSRDSKRIEYRLKNGKRAGTLTLKAQGKKFEIVRGRVKTIDGKDKGRVKVRGGKVYYLEKGKTFSGIHAKKLYKNGRANMKADGKIKVKGTVYLFKKGYLFSGIKNKRYYTNGLVDKTKTGIYKYKGRKYYFYKGKYANGLHGKHYYKNGKTDKTVKGYKTINGYKYYFIKGVLADPTIDHPLKILMIGNSYTFYNGYPQMLSKLIAKTNKSAIVVRATKGSRSLPQLMKEQINYVAWKDGEYIATGSGMYLEDIMNIDFGELKRAGKWDYIIAQNNEDDYTKTSGGDIEMFNFVRGSLKSSKRFILHGMYYSGGINDKRYKEHILCVEQCKCSIINSLSYYQGYKEQFGAKWSYDLTLEDSDHHPSGRGGYLLALCIYGKLFGVNSFARNETDKRFIKLYNSDAGKTNEFAPDYFKQKEAPDFAMSVTKSEAKKLQAYVRSHADEYLGAPLYKQSYNLVIN